MRRPARWSSIGSSPSSMNDDNISRDVLSESIVNLGICVLEDKLWAMVAKIDAHGRRGIQRPIRGAGAEAEIFMCLICKCLSKGFLERIKGKTFVIKSLALHRVVLEHMVAGFVTHCGWSSILEVVMRGMPMIGWPTYAEQRMDMVFIVEKMGVALLLDDGDDEFVVAEEQKKWDVNNDGFRHILAEELRKRRLMTHGETGESVLPLSHFRTSQLFPLRSPFNGTY
ncbi:UDP-glycosyltransferase 88A1 [Striga hermonthica]|uniref:UDP-glycosyltransferase 88A1 n=1 Tax=Striga hermonthica TaxID=68872 RepID=A0A9N7NII1_STRHE|nr:UDP-glycosyltransferase 88A1 [Striga hermonthica]